MQSSQQPMPIPFALTHQSFESYSKRQYRNVLPILRSLALNCRVCLKLPLLKVLCAMAKLFALTHIEAVFLVYLVKQTKWAIKDPIILRHSYTVRDVIVTHVSEEPEYKNLILYLTLACYSLKESLTDDGCEFQAVAVGVCPTFAEVYEEWSQRYAGYTAKISPKDINKIYIAHASLKTTQTEDYVSLVDKIIEESQSYYFSRKLKPKIIERIKEGTLEQPNPLPRREKRQGKMQIQFQNKFCASFEDTYLPFVLDVVSTNGFDDDLMIFGKADEDEGIFLFRGLSHERAHSDPLSQDEQCEEENLPPLSQENNLFGMPREQFSHDIQIASINESNYGGFMPNFDEFL